MDLFVVNRYDGDKTITEEEEKAKLDSVLKRIERNRKLRQNQKEKENKVKEAKKYAIEQRQLKKIKKASFIAVPENAHSEYIAKDEIAEIEDEKKVEVEEIPKNKKQKLDPTAIEGFTILGLETFDKKAKVKRVLPKWLSTPTVISVNLQNLQTKTSELKILDKSLRKLLKENNVKHLFPVQAKVIPWLIEANKHADVIFPRDICVSAPTGSGKTLAFVLPVIQALKGKTIKKIRALVILPTQDLATQVFKTFRLYAQNTNLDICLITGNNPFAFEQKQLVSQNEAFGFVSKVDILVCTAGRLVDHLKLTKGFCLKNLEFLIIDEADRVLDSVQNDWLYHLEKHIYEEDVNSQTSKILNLTSLQKRRPPQKLLFSATLSQDPEKLQILSLFQPKLFTSVVETEEGTSNTTINTETFIGKYTTPKELTEKYVVTSLDLKPLVLYKFIKQEKLTKTIIFTHSVESAHRLMILLKSLFKDEMKIQEISSHFQVKNRNDLIAKFSAGEIDLLVCTDALARGIDFPNVQCVISYSAPKHLKTYIHRAGRTARAGETGLAVTLLHKTQLTIFKTLLKQADKNNVEELTISEEDLEPLGEQYKQSLEDLKKTILKEEKEDLQKSKNAKRKVLKRKRKNSIQSNSSKQST
ncbi:unnamed protein product [Brassicogethes aeneus]|uniref:ATP-dependent RNA helicase n=1 Tax=Brassicogethes aeneus TaxID=1431903 RepID=A0A9P0FEZ7_BRAAE|nr:unnamed protein product [Brassicogethes aeneus]